MVIMNENMNGGKIMSESKRERERNWTVRKQDQHPHGKVKSFKELAGKENKE
jgi:Family of unknown function (DUF6254)